MASIRRSERSEGVYYYIIYIVYEASEAKRVLYIIGLYIGAMVANKNRLEATASFFMLYVHII